MNVLEENTLKAVLSAAHFCGSREDKRFRAACSIMSSLAPAWDGTDEDLANASVAMADALLRALK